MYVCVCLYAILFFISQFPGVGELLIYASVSIGRFLQENNIQQGDIQPDHLDQLKVLFFQYHLHKKEEIFVCFIIILLSFNLCFLIFFRSG